MKIPLSGKSISRYFFDSDNLFSGVELSSDDKNSERAKYVPINAKLLSSNLVDTRLQEAHDTTRLIGFRTGKHCKDSKTIHEITPIYYSIDEVICKHVIWPISEDLQTENPAYGLECGDLELQEYDLRKALGISDMDLEEEKNQKDIVKLTYLTFAVIWVILIMVSIIGCMRLC